MTDAARTAARTAALLVAALVGYLAAVRAVTELVAMLDRARPVVPGLDQLRDQLDQLPPDDEELGWPDQPGPELADDDEHQADELGPELADDERPPAGYRAALALVRGTDGRTVPMLVYVKVPT